MAAGKAGNSKADRSSLTMTQPPPALNKPVAEPHNPAGLFTDCTERVPVPRKFAAAAVVRGLAESPVAHSVS